MTRVFGGVEGVGSSALLKSLCLSLIWMWHSTPMTACQPCGRGGYLDGPAGLSSAAGEVLEDALLLLFFLAALAGVEAMKRVN